jgi:hypothetical protein
MSKLSVRISLVGVGLAVLVAVCTVVAQERKQDSKSVRIELGKVEESDTKADMPEPNFGYVGDLGSFVVSKGGEAEALIVVHQYPKTEVKALGRTKLTYEGTKRLGNVDGWVFKTEWDGKTYPSKIFFSSEKVYFGGGMNSYIAADYREGTGWAWKLLPLRRMEILK